MSLEHRGYRPLPLRRIYIPKSKAKDAAPRDPHDARPRHAGALPARARTHRRNPGGPQLLRVPQGTILRRRHRAVPKRWHQGPLDSRRRHQELLRQIGHEWLLAHIPMERAILRKWLRSGYLEKQVFFDTISGTPQGGIISPELAIFALDGLERRLRSLSRCEARAPNAGELRRYI